MPARPAIVGLARLASGILATALAALWLSSFRWYTTVGFDFERPAGPFVETTYDRVRWDVGVFWVGQAVQVVAPHAPTLDWWDPGGTLFARSIPPIPRSLANRLGFWLIRNSGEDPYLLMRYAGAKPSRWVGIPGFLPPALLAWLARRPRRAKVGSAREKATKGKGNEAIMSEVRPAGRSTEPS